MTCIDPPALADWELAMYLDDEATATVNSHIVACASCRARAATLAQQELIQQANLYRSNCPTPAEVRDYQMSLLARTDQSNIALHLARCAHCTRELFMLNSFLAPQATASREPWHTPIRLLVAALAEQFLGAGAQPQLAGQRGSGPLLQLYQSGDIQVGLEIRDDQATGTKVLSGLITNWQALVTPDHSLDLSEHPTTEPEQLLVHLWRNGTLVATAVVDPLLGDFRFAGLPKTTTDAEYELIISAQQTKLRLPNLQFQRNSDATTDRDPADPA